MGKKRRRRWKRLNDKGEGRAANRKRNKRMLSLSISPASV